LPPQALKKRNKKKRKETNRQGNMVILFLFSFLISPAKSDIGHSLSWQKDHDQVLQVLSRDKKELRQEIQRIVEESEAFRCQEEENKMTIGLHQGEVLREKYRLHFGALLLKASEKGKGSGALLKEERLKVFQELLRDQKKASSKKLIDDLMGIPLLWSALKGASKEDIPYLCALFFKEKRLRPHLRSLLTMWSLSVILEHDFIGERGEEDEGLGSALEREIITDFKNSLQGLAYHQLKKNAQKDLKSSLAQKFSSQFSTLLAGEQYQILAGYGAFDEIYPEKWKAVFEIELKVPLFLKEYLARSRESQSFIFTSKVEELFRVRLADFWRENWKYPTKLFFPWASDDDFFTFLAEEIYLDMQKTDSLSETITVRLVWGPMALRYYKKNRAPFIKEGAPIKESF
jgi:hypothetical protein